MRVDSNLPVFNTVKDRSLRNRNRGAIMANLLEDYYNDSKTYQYSYRDFLRVINEYTKDFSEIDYKEAKEEMANHLKKRGIRYGG